MNDIERLRKMLEKEMIDFREAEPQVGTKVLVFFPPEQGTKPVLCTWHKGFEIIDGSMFVLASRIPMDAAIIADQVAFHTVTYAELGLESPERSNVDKFIRKWFFNAAKPFDDKLMREMRNDLNVLIIDGKTKNLENDKDAIPLREAFEFAEMLAENYIRLSDHWIFKHDEHMIFSNWKTTEQLFKNYQLIKKFNNSTTKKPKLK